MDHVPNETLRKSIHIAFGLGAFALKWLPWWVAAIVAACAVVGNMVLLHRIVGTRVARHERGYDAGIVLYPLAVLLLIVVFRNHLAVAAVAWTTLAFGDGFATLIGRSFRIGSLPWNPDKSWGGLLAFLLGGIAAGCAVAIWLGGLELPHVVAAVVIGAIAETLPLRIDDNLTVPFATAVALTIASIHPEATYAPPPRWHVWLTIHTILAIAGYLLRTVDLSGLIGGWMLGAIVLLGAGSPLYVTLLTFFIVGTLVTKIGYARKKRMGLAQEKHGRRGFSHAFANVGVAAICSIALSRLTRQNVPVAPVILPLFMGIASLATAAADTTATEIGKLIGHRAFLPLTFKRVPPGTQGAVSVEGTLAGLVAAAIVAMIGTTVASPVYGLAYRTRLIVLVTVCAFVGSYLESVIGNWSRSSNSQVPGGVLNFINTVVGALLLYFAWPIAL